MTDPILMALSIEDWTVIKHLAVKGFGRMCQDTMTIQQIDTDLYEIALVRQERASDILRAFLTTLQEQLP